MKNVKIYIWATVVFLVILIGAYLYGRSTQKDKNQKALPNDDPNSPLTDAQSAQVARLTDALYEDMDGLNIFGRNTEIYKELVSLNDTMLVAVYNQFWKKYSQNLILWLEDENFEWSSISLQSQIDVVIDRLKKY